jgi:hypothetical protein
MVSAQQKENSNTDHSRDEAGMDKVSNAIAVRQQVKK